MAAVAKAAATSKFDLCCKPLSAQRAFMASTRDTRTDLMSRFVWSSVRCVYFYFRCDYRYIITGTTFISYAINSMVLFQVPRVNQPFIQYDIRTYQVHACMWWIHPYVKPRPRLFDIRSLSSESSVVLLEITHTFAATTRVPWRAIPYEYVFRSAIIFFCGASASTPIWASKFVMPLSRNCKIVSLRWHCIFVLRC